MFDEVSFYSVSVGDQYIGYGDSGYRGGLQLVSDGKDAVLFPDSAIDSVIDEWSKWAIAFGLNREIQAHECAIPMIEDTAETIDLFMEGDNE